MNKLIKHTFLIVILILGRSSTKIACPEEGEGFYGQDAIYKGKQPNYTDNGDGTVTDNNTGLMWQKDPGKKKTFTDAVAGASKFRLAGYEDWRLPTIKELQSIVDYARSPATINSAAIDPVFNATVIIDEGGEKNYPFYWSATTHARLQGGSAAAYVAFGSSLGWMRTPRNRNPELLDVHGAGPNAVIPR
jgi:hypothetical protein